MSDGPDQQQSRLARTLRAAFSQGATPQAFIDLAGRFEWANAAMGRLLGHPAEDLTGRPVIEFVDPWDPTGRDALTALLEGEASGSLSHELVARSSARGQVPLLVDLTALTGEDGVLLGVAVNARDLTDVREAERRLMAQQAFFRGLHRRAWDVALVADLEGNLVYVSPSVVDLLGYQPGELVSRSSFEFVHPDHQERVADVLARAVAAPHEALRETARVRDSDGTWRWVEVTVTNCVDDPDIGGLVANLRDLTGQLEAQHALERSEARYRAIVETAQEGIIALTGDGRTLLANEKLAAIVGYDLDDIYEHGLWCALDPDQAKRLHSRLLSRGDVGAERYEIRYEHPERGARVLSISASPLDVAEDLEGSLAMVADVTAEHRETSDLRRQALHDSLTGLPNRVLLRDRLEMAAARQARSGRGSLAVVFLDLDDLKRVNDRGGHESGDALLVEVARRLQTVLRHSDTLARLGGDEFAVVCEDTDEEGAVAVAQRILDMFAESFLVLGTPVNATASIGIALSPPHATRDLMRMADTAMYEAKASGKGTYVVFDSSLADASRRRFELARDLRAALGGAELGLHFQPVVDLPTGCLRGVEALVRWEHPELGLLPAAEVVAAAQDGGLEAELDRYVLDRACADMRELLRRSVLPADSYMSVNVSARGLIAGPIDAVVADLLDGLALRPEQLVLEVTETSIMSDVEKTVRHLRQVSATGVRIAVDDFGTGHSSLTYLHRLPLSILKVDRSFVAGLPGDQDSSVIVRSVVSLADALGLDTVAEGIETPEQADALHALGCGSGQGYLWSRAVPAAELERVVRGLGARAG